MRHRRSRIGASMRSPFRLPRCTSVAAAAIAISAASASAQHTDVIRGRVIAADSTPLRNAIVTAVDTAAKVPKLTRTDSTGAYSISFENGGGTYMVAVTMLGHAPQRRVVSRTADGSIPRVDFKMTPVAAQLGAVRSVGERPKAARSDVGGDFSTGGTTSYQSLSGGLSGDVTGDLSAILATLPGISVTPSVDGTLNVSAFGIGSDQNGLVLNGINFGAQVPRDGFRLAVISASYEPGHEHDQPLHARHAGCTGPAVDVRCLVQPRHTLRAANRQWLHRRTDRRRQGVLLGGIPVLPTCKRAHEPRVGQPGVA